MLLMLLLSCISFSLLGFIIGICSDNFEQINFVPMIIITPLVFLGGSFYTIDVLPDFWQTITLFNPIFYLVSGFRYSFFGTGEVNILISIFSISLGETTDHLDLHLVTDLEISSPTELLGTFQMRIS